MPPPSLDDLIAQRVAAGLTERMRAWILLLPADGSPGKLDILPSAHCMFRERRVVAGVSAVLVTGGWPTDRPPSLTPMGRRVRAAVLAHEQWPPPPRPTPPGR